MKLRFEGIDGCVALRQCPVSRVRASLWVSTLIYRSRLVIAFKSSSFLIQYTETQTYLVCNILTLSNEIAICLLKQFRGLPSHDNTTFTSLLARTSMHTKQ